MAIPVSTVLEPILRGDTYSIPVSFTDDQGQPADMTGWTLVFTMKINRLQGDGDASLQKRIEVTGTSAIVLLKPEDTNELVPMTYEYDVQLMTPDRSGITTMMMGTVEVAAGVTHTIL